MRNKRFKVALCLVVWILLPASADDKRIPAEPGVGEEWVQWNQETRQFVAYAYIIGYLDGSTHACVLADRLFAPGKGFADPKDVPAARCMEKTRSFSRGFEFYAKTITKFYETYPEDKRIPARFILRRLYDGEEITIKELHHLAQSGELIHRP
jgi:hypothetical protein